MQLQIGKIYASIEKYTSDADVKNRCSTQSGDSCVFPFTYRGKTYSQCITTGDINDKPWCSISTNSKGVHIEGINTWGYCKKSLSCHIWICSNKCYMICTNKFVYYLYKLLSHKNCEIKDMWLILLFGHIFLWHFVVTCWPVICWFLCMDYDRDGNIQGQLL